MEFEPYNGWSSLPEGELVMVLRGAGRAHLRGTFTRVTKAQIQSMELAQFGSWWKVCSATDWTPYFDSFAE